jgi:hypothetical protein
VAEQQVALAGKEEALAELERALLQQAEEAAAEAREAAALLREEMDAAFAEERAELERDWRHTVDVRRSPPSRERERERERRETSGAGEGLAPHGGRTPLTAL